MKGLSLFANVGIAETYLSDNNIDIIVANELLPQRALFYSYSHKTNVVLGDPSEKSELIDEFNENPALFFNEENYKVDYSKTMVCGDITKQSVVNRIITEVSDKIGSSLDFLIATPPCQGMSVAGAGLRINANDPRNTLIISVLDIISKLKPKYFLIENVPTMLNHSILVNNKSILITKYIDKMASNDYILNRSEEYQRLGEVANAADYGTPQSRKRAFILGVRKDISSDRNGFTWIIPKKKHKRITVRDAIGTLPSLSPGEDLSSQYKWHKVGKHNANHIKWLSKTPTGRSAFDNNEYEYQPNKKVLVDNKSFAWKYDNVLQKYVLYNIKNNNNSIVYIIKTASNNYFISNKGMPVIIEDIANFDYNDNVLHIVDNKLYYKYDISGSLVYIKISGYKTTYKRMSWDEPSPTITMGNGSISSQNNVHPGNCYNNNWYDNTRVLSLREIMILTGLDPDTWRVPNNSKIASDNMIRHVIGESIPPKTVEALILELYSNNSENIFNVLFE